MGELDVKRGVEPNELRVFMQRLLRDVRAFEVMLDSGAFETGVRRIGAEQEVFIVDGQGRPAGLALELLERLDDPHFTTELARFNLEFNLDPQEFGGDCLRRMEHDVNTLLRKARVAARSLDANVLLTGILPTLTKKDLSIDNMTPIPRYHALNDAMTQLRGKDYSFYIEGVDEFQITHDSVMLEACNTSFQVHFQVAPLEFARLYNVAQLATAPVMAVAANSPLLFGKRLWRETRIALFQQSVDTRAHASHFRESKPRVTFGTRWVDDSVLEIFREDIARFRVLLNTDRDEDPFEALARGVPPNFNALRLHNGTVYRWNRPCYGISEGKAHLRIENRVIPSGPSVIDEIANATFWFGLITALAETYPDIRKVMAFDDAKNNFFAAARQGLGAPITWTDGKTWHASNLIRQVLLPMAREALVDRGIDRDDIDRYLGVIEARAHSEQTGAAWLLRSYASMRHGRSKSERLSALISASLKRQQEELPVHEWPLAGIEEATEFKTNYWTVEQYMTTDIFTVNEDEAIDLVASVMDWQRVRHVPVEDNDHHLVGLVSTRTLLRLLVRIQAGVSSGDGPVPVSTIMERELVTVAPDTLTLDAIRIMREHNVSSLPVVKEGKLVGIVTEADFVEIARELLQEKLADRQQP